MLTTSHVSTETHHTATHLPHSPSLHDDISDDDSEISISRSTSTSISHDMTSWKAIKKRQEQARMLSAAGRDYDMDDDDIETPYPTTSNDSMRTSMSSYQSDGRTHATSTSTTTSKINIPTLQIPTTTITPSTPSPDVIDEVYAQLAQHLSLSNPKFNKAQRIIQERRSIAMQQRLQHTQHTQDIQSARYTQDTQPTRYIQQQETQSARSIHDIEKNKHDNEKEKQHDLREKTSIIHTGSIIRHTSESARSHTSGIASHPISPVTESRGLYQPSHVVTGAISASQSLPASTMSSPILGPVTLGSRHVSSPALAIQSTHNPVSHIIAALDLTHTMTRDTPRSASMTPTSDSRRLTTSMLQAMNTPPRQTTPTITSITSSPISITSSLPITSQPRISPDETRKRSVLDRLLSRTSPQHPHRKPHQRAASMSVSTTTSSVRLAKRRQWSAIGAMYEAEESESSQRRGKSVELTKIENKHDEDEEEMEETTEQRQARARMASIMGQAYDDVDSDDEKSSHTAPPVVPLPVTDIDSTVDAYAHRANERLRAITRHHVDVDDDISHDSKEIENSTLESDIRIQQLRAISAHGAAYEADASIIGNDEDDESDTESRLEARASQRLRQRMPLLSRDGAEYSEGESSIRRMSTSHHGSMMTYVRHVDVMTPHHENQQSISITPGRPAIEGNPISIDVDVNDEDEPSPALQGPNGSKPRVVMMHTSSTFVTRSRTSTPVSGVNISSSSSSS